MIFVTHKKNILKICDNTYKMKNGTLKNLIMPGFEIIGKEEKKNINEIFDKSNGVFLLMGLMHYVIIF